MDYIFLLSCMTNEIHWFVNLFVVAIWIVQDLHLWTRVIFFANIRSTLTIDRAGKDERVDDSLSWLPGLYERCAST